MKVIGYVLPSFPVLSETFIGTEMRAMQRQGHRIVPLAFSRHHGEAQAFDEELAAGAIYLEDVDTYAVLRSLRPASASMRRAWRFLMEQRALVKHSLLWQSLKLAAVAQQCGCQHLHAHFALATAATAITAARIAGMSVSFVGHGFDVYSSQKDLAAKLQGADFAVAVCTEMAEDFKKLAPSARVTVVHCGVEPERFRPGTGEREVCQRLLFIGRLVEKKGIDNLLRALAQMPSGVGLDIVGAGPQAGFLQTLTSQLDLHERVRFLGARDAQWIAAWGPQYLALIAPFRAAANGDRDTGPVVVKEAMAMALPVVATRFMGLREIVDHERSGLLVDVDDIEALAAAMQRIVTMPTSLRRAMGEAGRERVLRYFTAALSAVQLSTRVEAANP
jgi:glycosyltransferase involved in cell wall biosynthesis